MRKLIFVFLIALIAEDVSSQGDHFIYIQADDQQPFYVRSGSKTFQSSGDGYLVIPGLSSNNYELIIGFPGITPVTEWRFDCVISEKDLGFILKNKAPGVPELINMGQKDGITGIKIQVKEKKKDTPKPVELTGSISDDPFSKLLADVVNDPTIRQQPIIIEKKTEPVVAAITTSADSVNKAAISAKKEDSLYNSTTSLTAKIENKPLAPSIVRDSAKVVANTAPKEDKSLVLTETTSKADSGNFKTVTSKPDSTNLTNTIVAKPDNLPLVVKEIKKETNTIAPATGSVNNDSPASSTKATPVPGNTPFVLKETTNSATKPVATKDSINSTLTARSDESKPATHSDKLIEEPFVAKELPRDNKTSATKDSQAGNKTLPFTVEPKGEPFVVKEIPDADSKAPQTNVSAADKNTTPVTAQAKNESLRAKELSKTNNKTTEISDSIANKKTLPFTVQPKEEPLAVKEVPKTEDTKSRQNITANAGPDSNKTNIVTTNPKEDKTFVLKETIAGKNGQPDKTATASTAAKNVVTSSVSIKKTLQRRSIDGIELIYVDEGENGAKDTIRILIPGTK